MVEVSVIVKDSERRLKKDYVEYEEFTMKIDDPVIKKLVESTLAEFNGTPESVQVKVCMEV
jgi:hypothetical protein